METILVDGHAGGARLKSVKESLRKECAKRNGTEGFPAWSYVDDGCPKDDRVAACRFADGDDRRMAHVEWFYENAGGQEQLGELCSQRGGRFAARSSPSLVLHGVAEVSNLR
jgi:hypothetical protein